MPTYTAFDGPKRVASGDLSALKSAHISPHALIFEDQTGKQVDLDLNAPAAPGRPKLGVKPREVTLLPRHWEWLEQHSSGASPVLRKLVDAAMQTSSPDLAKDTAARFLTAMAGNYPGYEEATRALYAGDAEKFTSQTLAWPPDVRDYALQLAEPAFSK